MRIAVILLALLALGCAPQESPETKYNNLTKMIEEKEKELSKYQEYVNNFSFGMSAEGTKFFNQGRESELSDADKSMLKSLREATKLKVETEDKLEQLRKRRDALGF